MKKIILFAICLLPMAVMAQKPYTIKGKVGSQNAPAKAYLSYHVGTAIVTDSVELKNGTFEFKGMVDGTVSAALRLNHATAPVVTDPRQRAPQDQISFYLEPANIKVAAADSMKFAKITGSKANQDNEKLAALLKPSQDKSAAIMKEYGTYTADQRKDSAFMALLRERYIAASRETANINAKFASDNPDSYVGLVAFGSTLSQDINPAVSEPKFMKFTEELRNTAIGKGFAARIEGAKHIQIGAMAADFTQYTPDGKEIKLADFKGKYVLVDFWASWCGPCRAENPYVVAAYNKFKDKNFTVYGVSFDGGTTGTTKEKWLEAIQKDNLTWTHASELKGWENAPKKLYGINGIPYNFLLDPSGRVVAKNLRGEALAKKLQEVLGSKSK